MIGPAQNPKNSMAAFVFVFMLIMLKVMMIAFTIRPTTTDQITHFLALSADACASA